MKTEDRRQKTENRSQKPEARIEDLVKKNILI